MKILLLVLMLVGGVPAFLWAQEDTDTALPGGDVTSSMNSDDLASGDVGFFAAPSAGESDSVLPQETLMNQDDPATLTGDGLATDFEGDGRVSSENVREVETPSTDVASTEEQRASEGRLPTDPVEADAVEPSDTQEVLRPDDGPDTVMLSEETIGLRGNWVKKRQWLLRAREESQSVAVLAESIQRFRGPFWEKYKDVQEVTLDTFYREISKKQGALEYLRQRKGDVAVGGGVLRGQEEVEGVLADIDGVKQLDEALVKRMEKLDENMAMVVREATRAGALYNEIWDIIDDAKAREHFYSIKSIGQKLRSIQAYVQGDFDRDFNGVIDTTKKHIEKASKQLDILLSRFNVEIQQAQQAKDVQAIREREREWNALERHGRDQARLRSWYEPLFSVTSMITRLLSDAWVRVYDVAVRCGLYLKACYVQYVAPRSSVPEADAPLVGVDIPAMDKQKNVGALPAAALPSSNGENKQQPITRAVSVEPPKKEEIEEVVATDDTLVVAPDVPVTKAVSIEPPQEEASPVPFDEAAF